MIRVGHVRNPPWNVLTIILIPRVLNYPHLAEHLRLLQDILIFLRIYTSPPLAPRVLVVGVRSFPDERDRGHHQRLGVREGDVLRAHPHHLHRGQLHQHPHPALPCRQIVRQIARQIVRQIVRRPELFKAKQK